MNLYLQPKLKLDSLLLCYFIMLAWGLEAIVCDDPNYQGRGNPSSDTENCFDRALAGFYSAIGKNLESLQPTRVILAIVDPVLIAVSKSALALIAGKSSVLKPPTQNIARDTMTTFFDYCHSALHNEYWRLIDPQGKPTGVMGWWASRADNHDTGSTQVGDALVMKLEQFDWNPSKENQLEGS
ncbi:hypothetical protein JHK87_011945 [Glycine soja]|nr:hypothetical protein JHK87_011945 [Glycine soja]